MIAWSGLLLIKTEIFSPKYGNNIFSAFAKFYKRVYKCLFESVKLLTYISLRNVCVCPFLFFKFYHKFAMKVSAIFSLMKVLVRLDDLPFESQWLPFLLIDRWHWLLCCGAEGRSCDLAAWPWVRRRDCEITSRPCIQWSQMAHCKYGKTKWRRATTAQKKDLTLFLPYLLALSGKTHILGSLKG